MTLVCSRLFTIFFVALGIGEVPWWTRHCIPQGTPYFQRVSACEVHQPSPPEATLQPHADHLIQDKGILNFRQGYVSGQKCSLSGRGHLRFKRREREMNLTPSVKLISRFLIDIQVSPGGYLPEKELFISFHMTLGITAKFISGRKRSKNS